MYVYECICIIAERELVNRQIIGEVHFVDYKIATTISFEFHINSFFSLPNDADIKMLFFHVRA